MKPTPIEEYAARAIHNMVFNKAKTKGMCWDCSQQAGFAATNVPMSKPKVCKNCQGKEDTK